MYKKCLITLSLLIGYTAIAEQYPQVISPRNRTRGITQPQQEAAPQALTEEEQLELMKKMGLADMAEDSDESLTEEVEVEDE